MAVKNNKKYSIAMYGHKRIPSREGGVEVVVEELATRMAERGHNVTCYNRRGHHISGSDFDKNNIVKYKNVKIRKVFTVDVKGLAAVTSSFFAAVFTATGRYDIVHIHAEGPAAFCWIPKMFGKRVICTVHGLDHQRAKWGRFARAYIMMGEKNAVRYADEIIVLSENVRTYFIEKYRKMTKYIPNGIERPQIRKAELINDIYGLSKDEYILFLGRLVPEKGVQYLIEAFKGVQTNKKLVIAGGSSDTDAFEKKLSFLAEKDKRIIFTGFIQGQILEELYSNAYIYTLPSDLEGMPISLLEAMSYGNCCLTSDIAECTDVTCGYACSFSKGNVQDLREKLQFLCENYDVVKAYREGVADYICKKYNWEDVVEQILDLYTKDDK